MHLVLVQGSSSKVVALFGALRFILLVPQFLHGERVFKGVLLKHRMALIIALLSFFARVCWVQVLELVEIPHYFVYYLKTGLFQVVARFDVKFR